MTLYLVTSLDWIKDHLGIVCLSGQDIGCFIQNFYNKNDVRNEWIKLK